MQGAEIQKKIVHFEIIFAQMMLQFSSTKAILTSTELQITSVWSDLTIYS
jgi:hypothetical protein